MVELVELDPVEIKKWTKNFKGRHLIAEGKSGMVFEGLMPPQPTETQPTETEEIQVQQKIAVKRYPNTRDAESEWKNEVQFLKQQEHKHKNIIEMIGYAKCDEFFYLVLPFVEGVLSNDKIMKGLDMTSIQKIIKGISEALRVLHNNNKVHSDIKLQNILVTKDYTPIVCDFANVGEAGQSGSTVHTPGYSPDPKAGVISGKYQPAKDMFALGTVILCVLVGTTEEIGDINQNNHISQNQVLLERRIMRTGEGGERAQTLFDIGLACCSRDPQNRPTIGEVCDVLEGRRRWQKRVAVDQTKEGKKGEGKGKAKNSSKGKGTQQVQEAKPDPQPTKGIVIGKAKGNKRGKR